MKTNKHKQYLPVQCFLLTTQTTEDNGAISNPGTHQICLWGLTEFLWPWNIWKDSQPQSHPQKKWELLVTLMKIQDLFYLWGCQRNRSFCILVVGMQWHYAGGYSNTLWDNKLKKRFILWLSNSTPRNVFYALTCINEEWHAQFFLIFFSFSFPPSLLLQFLSICGKGLWNCVNILFLNKLLIK